MFREGVSNWNFPALQISSMAELEALPVEEASQIAAVVIEPMVQGAAGIRLWPAGTLTGVRNWCDRSGALLMADEVLTGFGRTGKMFACQHENVFPDIMILAKALTGWYLPLAITLLTEQIFSAFAASSEAESTLYYGHSYTGNALACATANASLEIFEKENVLEALVGKIAALRAGLSAGAALGRECAAVRIDCGSGIANGSRRKTWSRRVPGRAQPRTPNETDPQRDRLDATFLHHALPVAPGRSSHRVRDRRGLWRKRACQKW
jgi:adenosylmethionine---8-amino-7-oxononanoate aminotransferase